MNLIVSAAIVLLNPYVTVYISYKIPPFALSVHIPDVSTSIYVEVDSKVLLGFRYTLGFTSCALHVASREHMTDILTAAS